MLETGGGKILKKLHHRETYAQLAIVIEESSVVKLKFKGEAEGSEEKKKESFIETHRRSLSLGSRRKRISKAQRAAAQLVQGSEQIRLCFKPRQK